jgi:hypothetical protein
VLAPDPLEGDEQPLHRLGRDAEAGVGDLDPQPAAGHRLAGQVHAAALAVVLHGVGQQVQQDLLEPLTVTQHVGGTGDLGPDHDDAVLVDQGPGSG